MSNFNKVGRGTSEPNACGDQIRPVLQARSMKQESPISGGECQLFDVETDERLDKPAKKKRKKDAVE